jgi:hypothetical protein
VDVGEGSKSGIRRRVGSFVVKRPAPIPGRGCIPARGRFGLRGTAFHWR